MNKSIGGIVLNFAVAIYLLATGILGVTGKGFFKDGGEIRKAVTSLFGNGNFSEILIVILGILAIAAGVFILLRFFGVDIAINELLLIILAVVWVVFIILIDIVYPLKSGANFVDWLRSLGSHLMALGGILLATERFGG